MYERKEIFFKRIRNYACECHKAVNDAINELELFLEYRETKSEVLRSAAPLPPKDEIILRLSDENTGTVTAVNLLEPFPTHAEVMPKHASQIASLPSSSEDDEIMKYLSKRSDGRWQYRRTVNGKRIYIYGRTQAICLLKVKEAQKKNFRTGERKLMSFHSFARWWLDTFKKDALSPNTFKVYSYIVNKHLKIDIAVNYVTAERLQKVLNGLPPTRIREKTLQIVREICKKAFQLDYMKKDISQFLSAGKIKRQQVDAVLPQDQAKLIGALGTDDFSLRVLFYLLTGARPTEIASISPESFQKGYLLIKGTKTDAAVRWVKVSDNFTETFRNKPASFYRFDNKRFRQRLQRFCGELGIKDITVYRLRHTFATNLFILGVPDKERQHYMGHTTTRMTNDVYTDFCPGVTKEDIRNIFGEWYPEF